MDSPSISASVVALITAACRITEAISRLRKLGEVPASLYAMRNQVTDLEVVLRQLRIKLEIDTVDRETQNGLNEILTKARSNLLDLSKALKRFGESYEGHEGNIASRSDMWLKEKSHLDKLHVDIRSVKESLCLVIGISTTRDLHRIQLELYGVSLLTAKSGEQHEIQSDAVSKYLQGDHLLPSSRNGPDHDDLDARLDILKQTILEQGQADTSAPVGSERIPPLSDHFLENKIETVKVVASQLQSCLAWCPCACHGTKRNARVAGLGILENLIGKIFVGYSGVPLLNKKCSFEGCTHQQSLKINVEYWFPWWFVSMNMKLCMTYLGSGPQFQLTTTRRVPDTAQSIKYVMQNDIGGLKYLFSNGLASVRDVSDTRGFSLMRWALYGGWDRGWRYEMVQFLIAQGAVIDDLSYENVWDFKFRNSVPPKALEELRCITDNSKRDWVDEQNFPPVHQIVLGLSRKLLEAELQENPLAVYQKDTAGRTALDWAVARAQVDDVFILLKHGAEANTMDTSGRTAILHAVDCDSTLCLRMLLEYSANPDPKLPAGIWRSSPLTAAAVGGKKEIMKVLLEFGAYPNVSNPEGETPLHSVAQFQDASCALVLLDHGANLNAVSRNGRTPLTTAIIYNNHEVLQLFIDRCDEYIIAARLQAPQLVTTIAEYAKSETMTILASSPALKLSYELDSNNLAISLDILRSRRDYSEKLEKIFEEFITIARAEQTDTAPVERQIESGLYFSAASSFHSELSEALEVLEAASDSCSEREDGCKG